MPSAGQLLQSERLRQQKTVNDIAEATRINARYIEALEHDDPGQLPGAFFYKAFVRQYANALELNQADTDRILRATVSVDDPDPVPAFNHAYANAAVGEPVRWAPPVGVAVGLLLAVIAGGAGLYAIWQKLQHQPEVAQTSAASVPVHTSQPAHAQPQAPAATSSPASTAPIAGETTPATAAGSGETSLELVASEPTWVQLSSDGKMIYIGILDPSTPKQFRVAGDARLLTGNAGGLEVRLNGKPIGSIGPKGQIRTVMFSSGSFQIVPSKPKSQPNTTPSPAGRST